MISKLDIMQQASRAMQKTSQELWNLDDLFDPVTGDALAVQSPASGALGTFIVQHIEAYYGHDLEHLTKDLANMAEELGRFAHAIPDFNLEEEEAEDTPLAPAHTEQAESQ